MNDKAIWPIIYQDSDKKLAPHIESWIDAIETNKRTMADIAKECHVPIESIIHAISCRHFDLGQTEKATTLIKQALERNPDPIFHSQYLRCLMSLPGATKQEFRDENLKWAELYGKSTNPLPDNYFKDYDLNPDKKLRIGFICCYAFSSLFRTAIAPIMNGLKQRNVTVVFFNIGDVSSDWLLETVNENVNILDTSTETIFSAILNKKIDMLIDLNGRFRIDNPIEVLLQRPAPIIVSYGNMLGTYGLDVVKYMLADPYAVPPKDDKFYTEKIFRFESGDAGTFAIPDAPMEPPPMLKTGFVTYGSFNNLFKLNDEVLDTWGEILSRVPNSKLFIKAESVQSTFFRKRMVAMLTKHKIHPSRIILEKFSQFGDMIMKYNHIDIALNTFPYSGGTTTAFALWMGLPSLTLEPEDDSMVSGGAGGVVISPGFGDFVVSSREAYIQKAVELAQKPEYLTEIRKNMRDTLKKTARFNPTLFAEDFEKQCRAIWNHWLQNAQIEKLRKRA